MSIYEQIVEICKSGTSPDSMANEIVRMLVAEGLIETEDDQDDDAYENIHGGF